MTYLHPEFVALRRARDDGRPLREAWQAFREKARSNSDHPPFIVRDVVEQVRAQQGERAPEEITILDHGCGGGFALLYLLALGYTEIYGVDLTSNEDKKTWNELCAEVSGLPERRFRYYDGTRLPFENDSFDIVFSTQVVEHIEQRFWDIYFSEEARVLKPGGRAFHEIPHRLSPYDSHTQTWFVHYLPRPIHQRFYRLSGRGPEDIHYLRLPSTIEKTLRRHIGRTENLTMRAFLANADPETYDGPSGLRRFVHAACSFPVLGPIARIVMGPFIMYRLVAIKPAPPNKL